jgi:hypothetical protein
MVHKDGIEYERGSLSTAAKRLLAIVAYYIAGGVGIALAWRYSPSLRELLAGTSLADLASGSGAVFTRPLAADSASVVSPTSAMQQGKSTLFVLAGALATAIPVSLVYSLTRRRRGFQQSMVHILVLLPVAVAGMVVLIQNSLALAFSLAGIVAVLRFRNTLDDVKDGVYIFIGVSIGISAAVGALNIGLLTSVVFNACVLVLWWLDFARRPTPGIRGGLRNLARLPKVMPAKQPNERDARGDGRDGDEVFASAARAWRRQLQLTAEHSIATPKGHAHVSLRIHTSAPDLSRPAIEEVLRERTHRWELVAIVPNEGGNFTLKYRVRMRRSGRAELLDAVRAAPETVGVELR